MSKYIGLNKIRHILLPIDNDYDRIRTAFDDYLLMMFITFLYKSQRQETYLRTYAQSKTSDQPKQSQSDKNIHWASFFIAKNYYENTPIQIYRKFLLQKLKIFQIKNSDIFHISAQNIDCGYSLEPPRRGGSNEYPQSMFCAK